MILKNRKEFLNESFDDLFGVDKKKELIRDLIVRFGKDELFYTDDFSSDQSVDMTPNEKKILFGSSTPRNSILNIVSLALNIRLDIKLKAIVVGTSDISSNLKTLLICDSKTTTKKEVSDAILKYLDENNLLD